MTICCLLVDSDLPPNLWSEHMLTSACLCNRVPHSAPVTPHKTLYGKGADLSHLKIIGARAFTSRNQLNLGTRSGKGWCVVPANNIITPIACVYPGSELSLNQPEEKLLDGDKKHYLQARRIQAYRLLTKIRATIPIVANQRLRISLRSPMDPLAQSTMEVELVAEVLTMKEAVFCSNIMVELGFEKGSICVPLCTLTTLRHSTWPAIVHTALGRNTLHSEVAFRSRASGGGQDHNLQREHLRSTCRPGHQASRKTSLPCKLINDFEA